MGEIWDWFRENRELAGWIGAASGVMFVGSLLLLPVLIARLPADYFAERRAPALAWYEHHPVLGPAVRIGRNVLGAILIAMGILMLVLPGQGILTILIGLVLMQFPGKRALEMRVVGNSRVLKALNWLRRRSGHEPLEAPHLDE